MHTAKRTQHFTVANINCHTLFKEMIADYIENHMKRINTYKYKIHPRVTEDQWVIAIRQHAALVGLTINGTVSKSKVLKLKLFILVTIDVAFILQIRSKWIPTGYRCINMTLLKLTV